MLSPSIGRALYNRRLSMHPQHFFSSYKRLPKSPVRPGLANEELTSVCPGSKHMTDGRVSHNTYGS
ncbi:hypothetical protein BIW11_02506 [Tropilaelaps mercedesae]|uniref:Uncharacterized protein n=1 Tax=Tropilaelaps mercedesae TaxID=418985 RepID=A0A1V9Y2D6_9ACAR|nr:hypothetical protein BIW11_02506 [Tropilaelaps mercedesae]